MSVLFRKQFACVPRSKSADVVTDWACFDVGSNQLFVQPTLPVNMARGRERNSILLGTAIHCLEPTWKESDIAKALSKCATETQFLDTLDCLCGTFVVIDERGEDIRFFNDVASSGKLFYLNTEEGALIGSDPRLIGHFHQLVKDEDPDAAAYYASPFFKNANNKKWLGDRTWYKGVFQVLPNHGFHLQTKNVFRYYPRTKREEIPVGRIIEESAELLENIVNGVFTRDDGFVSVTAGWDSRVIMASTKPFADRATYYTFEKPGNAVNDKDVAIAQRICRDLGLNHRLVRPPKAFPEVHASAMRCSFELGEDKRCLSFLGLFDEQLVEHYTLTGSISEIAKNYFERLPIGNGLELAKAAHFPATPYVVNYFQAWIDRSKSQIEQLGYTPQDFAHWEQDIANFAGQGIMSTSYVSNRISPFNCRKLIDLILHANIDYRDGYNSVVYRGIIQALWPELLRYPVNPTLKVRLINLAKKTGVYPVYRRIRQRLLD